jgi:hypothetical protein
LPPAHSTSAKNENGRPKAAVAALLFHVSAGGHDLETGVFQAPNDDPGRRAHVHDHDRKIGGSK